MALKNNTWKLNQWYDQDVAGNVTYSSNIKHLFGWGRNNLGGILGQNNETHYSSPVQIPGATWKHISMDGNNAYNGMANKTDGTLWVWGSNGSGALGQNEAPTTQYSSPVQVPGTNWSDAFHCASGQGLASKTDGTLWIWGNGNDGFIGQNQPNNSDYSSPVQIPGTNWSEAIALSYNTSIATKTDGTLWSWGENDVGELGLNGGGSDRRSSPTQIPGTNWSTEWSQIASAFRAYAVTKTDGTLWAWGQNNVGQLGQENTAKYSSPVQVGSDTDWESISSNTYNFYGTKLDTTP